MTYWGNCNKEFHNENTEASTTHETCLDRVVPFKIRTASSKECTKLVKVDRFAERYELN